MKDFTTRVCPGHVHKVACTLEANSLMPKRSEIPQVTAWPTTEIKDSKRMCRFDHIQQCGGVLGDIVVPRTFPELTGPSAIIGNRHLREVPWISTFGFRLQPLDFFIYYFVPYDVRPLIQISSASTNWSNCFNRRS